VENVKVKKNSYVDIIFKLFIGVFIVFDLVFLVQKSIALITLIDASFFLSLEEILTKNKSIIIEIVILLILLIVASICFVKNIKKDNIFMNLNIKSKIKFIVLLIVFIVGIGCYTSLAINDYNQQKIIEANEAKEKAISDSRAELLIKTKQIYGEIMEFKLSNAPITGIEKPEDIITYTKKYTDILDTYEKLLKSKKDVIKQGEEVKYGNLITATENMDKKLYDLMNFFDEDYKIIVLYKTSNSSMGLTTVSKAAAESTKKYIEIISNYSDLLTIFVNSCTDFVTEFKK